MYCLTVKNPLLCTLTARLLCEWFLNVINTIWITFNQLFLLEPISVHFLWQVDQSLLSTRCSSRGGRYLLGLTFNFSQSLRRKWQKPLWRFPLWPIPDRGRCSLAFNTPRDPPQQFPGGESGKPEVSNETDICYFCTRTEGCLSTVSYSTDTPTDCVG